MATGPCGPVVADTRSLRTGRRNGLWGGQPVPSDRLSLKCVFAFVGYLIVIHKYSLMLSNLQTNLQNKKYAFGLFFIPYHLTYQHKRFH